MAGDWIKMRVDLQSHPKVVRIMSACGADKFRVIGGLHAVWSVFDAHSESGELHGYSLDSMDQVIGWPGFSTAMASVGWLSEVGEGLVATRFEDHNGKTAKRRATETERKRNARKMSAQPADKKRTREEKRREDITPSGKPSGVSARDALNIDLPDWLDPDVWQLFVDHRTSIRKKLSASASMATIQQLAKAKSFGHDPNEMIRASIANGWQGVVFERHLKPAVAGQRQQGGKSGAQQWAEMEEGDNAII